MAFDQWKPEDLQALGRVYDAADKWRWEHILNGGGNAAEQAVRDWLSDCPPPGRFPLVFPIAFKGNRSYSWFAISFTDSQFEELREQLCAFLGTVATDFNGVHSPLPEEIAVTHPLVAWTGRRYFHFNAFSGPENQDFTKTTLKRMLKGWSLRPTLTQSSFQTTESLLREFHQALTAQQHGESECILDHLRSTGRLSVENLAFLRVERYAAFQQWHDLTFDPVWETLKLIRRPARITRLMLQSLWHTGFRDFVEQNPIEAVRDKMRTVVLPNNRNLFRFWRGGQDIVSNLVFLMAAVADTTPRVDLAHRILGTIPETHSLRPLAESLATLLPKSQVVTPVAAPVVEARQCIDRDDYGTAWDILIPLEPTYEVVQLLFTCAAEGFGPAEAELLKARKEACSLENQTRLLASKKRKQTWEEIGAQLEKAANPDPVNWEDLVKRITHDLAKSEAIRMAEEVSGKCSPSDYAGNHARIDTLARMLDEIPNPASQVLRVVFPKIVSFFLNAEQPEFGFRPIWDTLLQRMALESGFSVGDWGVSETLSMAILQANWSDSTAVNAMEALNLIWETHGGLQNIVWSLDVLDQLVLLPNTITEQRDAFFYRVYATLKQCQRRVDESTAGCFRLLCEDLCRLADFKELFPTFGQAPTDGSLSETDLLKQRIQGKVIGIYTLTESSGLRAQQLLQNWFPGLDVRVSNDHGGSDHLKNIARQSDYMIVAAKSAKHAATDFIKAERPADKSPLIYPSGKGSSSIVDAVFNALRNDITS
jgi:hypothetical protein